MEKKIDELLAQAEKDQEGFDRRAAATNAKGADDPTNDRSSGN